MPKERSQTHKNTHCMTTLYANLEKSKLTTETDQWLLGARAGKL